MNSEAFVEKLKNSSIAVGTYIPSSEIKTATHIVITLNNKPFISVGRYEDETSKKEVTKLINSETFKQLVLERFKKLEDGISVNIKNIKGSDIEWQEFEYCLIDCKKGHSPDKGEKGDLLWIIFGKNAEGVAALFAISEDIEKILIDSRAEK